MANSSIAAEAVIFAINSAIKLGHNAQRAYAKSIKAKAIVLPLPKFDATPTLSKIHSFFEDEDIGKGGKQYLSQIERLKILHEKHPAFQVDEQKEYTTYYNQLRTLTVKGADADINADDFVTLLRIRQWETGKMPGTTPLQMVAGTLVEIGIDYFNQVPGALNKNSAFGMAMMHFLDAFDDATFSDSGKLKEYAHIVLPKLFVVAAEVVSDMSTEISSDEKMQNFIRETGNGIAHDVLNLMQGFDRDHTLNAKLRKDNQDQSVIWGQSILRSLIKNSGTYVFNAPAAVFNVNQSESALIKATGSTLMDMLLNDPHKINMKAGFTVDSLDRLVKAALEVVAEYPELVTEEDGLREIIMQVSQTLALSSGSLLRASMLPEIVRLILESTAQNLDLIWEPERDDVRNLLVLAARQTLEAISTPIPGATWEPRLTHTQVLTILENILDEVVANPEWVRSEISAETPLSIVLKSVMRALSEIPKGQRINTDVLEYIIQVGFRAAATNEAIIHSIHWADDAEEVVVLNKALDLLFHFIFKSEKVERSNRVELLIDLLDYIMDVILIHHPGEKGLMLVDLILFDSVDINYTGGFDEELADQLIEAALLVIGEHPELVSNQLALKQMVAGVAIALKKGLENSSYDKGDIFPELLRLVMEYTALNIDLILNKSADNPDYLLVVALQDLLTVLAQKESDTDWSPRLTPGQAIDIIENLFEEILYHPEWVVPQKDGNALLSTVTALVFEALRTRKPEERLTAETLEAIIEVSLQAAIITPELLEKTHWGTTNDEIVIWQKVIGMAMDYVFHDSSHSEELLAELLEYILEVIMVEHPDKTGLLLTKMILFESGIDYSEGFDNELADELINASLKVLRDHSDLLVRDDALQRILEGVTDAMDASDFHDPQLLPELLRVTLFYTSENANLILPATSGTPRFLLVDTLKQLLAVLSAPPTDNEKWRPNVSPSQAIELVDSLFEEVFNHPEWIYDGDDEHSLFNEVISTIFNTLAKMPKDARFSAESLEWIIRNSIRTISEHQSILAKVKWGSSQQEIIIFDKALDLIFEYVFAKSNVGSSGDKTTLFVELMEYVLSVVLSNHPDKNGLLLIQLILFKTDKLDLTKGFDEDQADDLIEAGVEVLSNYPELATKDVIFRKLIRDTTQAVKTSGYTGHDMVPELIRIMMLQVGQNIDQIMRVKGNGPKNILSLAIQQTLKVLAKKPTSGTWKPILSKDEVLDVISFVLEKVQDNPAWVQDEIIFVVLKGVYQAFELVPEGRPLPHETVVLIIETAIEAVALRKQLVDIEFTVQTASGSTRRIALTYSLEKLFIELYDEDNQSTGTWTLTQKDTINSILEYYILSIAEGPTTQEEIDAALEKIQSAITDINNNLASNLEDLLNELENG